MAVKAFESIAAGPNCCAWRLRFGRARGLLQRVAEDLGRMLRTLFFCDDLTIPDAHALLTPIGLQGAFRFKVERYADVVVDRAVGQRTAGPGQARQARAL